MTTTLLVVILIYYSIVLPIGFWKFQNQTKGEYLTATNSTGYPVLTLTLLGTIVGGGMFLGIAQIGYNSVMTAFAFGIAYLIGSAILGVAAPTLRRECQKRNVSTLFGLFESLYPSTNLFSVTTLFIWTTFAVFLIMLSAQFIGIGTFLEFFMGIQPVKSILIVASFIAVMSTLCYSAFGGFTRDMWADCAQMAFITLGVGGIILTEYNSEVTLHLSKLPPETFEISNGNLLFFIEALFFVAPTFFLRFDLWQRILTAKTDRVAKSAFISSGIIAFFFFAFFGLLGLYGKTLGITNEKYVALEFIQQRMDGIKFSLAIAAFFAAVMSTADTFLGVTAASLARGTIFRNNLSFESTNDDANFVLRLRYITLSVGVLSLGLAYIIKDIVNAFAFSFGLLMVFLPSLIGGFFGGNVKEDAARWSAVCGLIALVISAVVFGFKSAYLPGLVISTFIYVLLSQYRKKTA